MVMGILSPHLSQRAVIPHLMAIAPVRLEFGVMTLGFVSMIREEISNASALNNLEFVVVLGVTEMKKESNRRREMRPLDGANTYIYEH